MATGEDVLFGYFGYDKGEERTSEVLYFRNPHRLLYSKRVIWQPIEIATKDGSPGYPGPRVTVPSWKWPWHQGFPWYSEASLENIQTIHAFTNKWGNFTGMILKYADGATRSVGECRLGVDQCTTTHLPRRMCFARMKTGNPKPSYPVCSRFTVEIGEKAVHNHLEPEFWTCCALEGWLECWAAHLHMELAVRGQESKVPRHWDRFLPQYRDGMRPEQDGRVTASAYVFGY